MNMTGFVWTGICFIFICGYVEQATAYYVGSGLNVRFAQLLPTDNKFQMLREQLIRKNTKALVKHCRGDDPDCVTALSRIRFKPSKQFYALAKAVVAYVKSESTAIPSGYVGTAMFCHENTCIPDMDPPVVYGGCSELISCGGNKNWIMAPPSNAHSTRE